MASTLSHAPLGGMLRITAQDPGGQTHRLEFNGVTQTEAVRRVAARGFRLLSIEREETLPQTVSGRGARFPLNLFSQELLALLNAGLNLTEALTTLHAKEQHDHTKEVLAAILRSLREGQSFSDVLAGHPRHFPDVYIATVRASEQTGDIGEALARYIAQPSMFPNPGTARENLSANLGAILDMSLVSFSVVTRPKLLCIIFGIPTLPIHPGMTRPTPTDIITLVQLRNR